MMAAQQHGPTIWNWCRLSSGNRVRSPVAMETVEAISSLHNAHNLWADTG
jgi:hypothetical protein